MTITTTPNRSLLLILVSVFSLFTDDGRAKEETMAQPDPGMVIENRWIPMPDGVRLAVDLYMPGKAKPGARYPVLLEYLPYRKMESRGPDRRPGPAV